MPHSVGTVGTGFVAGQHAQAYEEVEELELCAVCDIDSDSLKQFGDEWSVPERNRYSDHSTMVSDENPDIVSITTPSFLHYQHVIDVAQSNERPDIIWCEKPIALSVANAAEMVRVCNETGAELVINHHRRFSNAFQTLKSEIYEGNLLGDIKSVTIRSGRELIRNGTHSVDLLVDFLDEPVEHVTGYITGENGMNDEITRSFDEYTDAGGGAILTTAGDTYVLLDHQLPRVLSPNTIDFIGTTGRLEVAMGGEWRYWQLEESEWNYDTPHRAIDQSLAQVPLPDSLADVQQDSDFFVDAATHLVDLLEGNAENRSPGSEATQVLEILVAVFISASLGARVSLPLEQPLRGVRITSW